jgi:hypothetical protein
MAGLDPAIHEFDGDGTWVSRRFSQKFLIFNTLLIVASRNGVDGRVKPGHDK